MRFVNSLGLGDPPPFATVGRRLERYPGLRFKLDARPSWSPSLIAEVAATGAVEVIDFKGRYGIPVEDEAGAAGDVPTGPRRASPTRSSRTLTTCPMSPRCSSRTRRASRSTRRSRPPPTSTAPFGARIINVKPSRIGSVRALLDVYEHCEPTACACTAAGWASSGSARGQIELLAALFHPDGPNDVAPSAYNLTDLPAGLPESPLTPPTGMTGFRWA